MMGTVCDIAEEINAFKQYLFIVAVAYTISWDIAARVPGVTKTDRGFMFTG